MSGDDDAAEQAYRVRQHRRATVTLFVVVAGLVAAFYYASSYFQGGGVAASPCATITSPGELRPADISVNVYNSTRRPGLARTVATELIDRGFKVKTIDNDPLKKTIKASAELRHGPAGLESAKVLQKHLPGSVLVADKREGDTVDLAIGNGYKAMGKVPPAVQPSVTVSCPPSTGT